MQIHPATMALGQVKQGQQGLAVGAAASGTLAIGRPDHPTQQSLASGHPPGQGLPLRREPMGHRCQGHQLQLQPLAPALTGRQQGFPAGFGCRPHAIDVAADRPHTVAPGPLQSALSPLSHLLNAALNVFALVGS